MLLERLSEPDAAYDTVRHAGNMAFEAQVPLALLLAQRLIGAKTFPLRPACRPRASEHFPLRRREVAKMLLAGRGDLLVVAGLGSPNWDATAAGDHPLTFPLWGAMGSAAMIGLGLALAQPSAPRPGADRRRRAADGARRARDDRRPAPGEPCRGGARQRALRRDRHAGDPHGARRRPRRHRAAAGFRVAGTIRAAGRARARPPGHRAASRARSSTRSRCAPSPCPS